MADDRQPEEEQLTETEWRQRENARLCRLDGHSYDVASVRGLNGIERPLGIRCSVCSTTWPVGPVEEDGGHG